jgi:hypothetical protein
MPKSALSSQQFGMKIEAWLACSGDAQLTYMLACKWHNKGEKL